MGGAFPVAFDVTPRKTYPAGAPPLAVPKPRVSLFIFLTMDAICKPIASVRLIKESINVEILYSIPPVFAGPLNPTKSDRPSPRKMLGATGWASESSRPRPIEETDAKRLPRRSRG